jgi:hypothetical protein
MWHTNNYELQHLQQQEYVQARRREADAHRRVQQATRTCGTTVTPYAIALDRLGGWLVALGERLQAQDGASIRSEPIR